MITGNKGEWSEVYTLLKIISDKKLFAGDMNLNKIENLIYPIIKVLRDESGETYEFSYNQNLVIIRNQVEEIKIPVSEFATKTKFLLSKLQEKTKGTFSIPQVEEFLKSFNCVSLKAKSTVKSDIRVVIHDQHTGTNPELGFSIKSRLGNSSTLLNAGKTTNFIYKLIPPHLTKDQIASINNINTRSKIKDRIQNIRKKDCLLSFIGMEYKNFENNLILIDSSLPRIISEIVYLFFTSKISDIPDLVKQIINKNPLNFDLKSGHPFYEYKIKRFLSDIALGMKPSEVWTGELDATGGYLVVKEDGEILCYHIYNRNEFEDYLYQNTKLETASSSRHGFGKIYSENQDLFFKLNLQIRFK